MEDKRIGELKLKFGGAVKKSTNINGVVKEKLVSCYGIRNTDINSSFGGTQLFFIKRKIIYAEFIEQ
jgi:hypothetical protein